MKKDKFCPGVLITAFNNCRLSSLPPRAHPANYQPLIVSIFCQFSSTKFTPNTTELCLDKDTLQQYSCRGKVIELATYFVAIQSFLRFPNEGCEGEDVLVDAGVDEELWRECRRSEERSWTADEDELGEKDNDKKAKNTSWSDELVWTRWER